MESTNSVDRAQLLAQIADAVHDQVMEDLPLEEVPAQITEQTVLFGPGGVLDSLGLVATLLNIEQRVQTDFGVSIVIADDRAMSQAHSPFRSVGRLTDYVTLLIEEQRS